MIKEREGGCWALWIAERKGDRASETPPRGRAAEVWPSEAVTGNIPILSAFGECSHPKKTQHKILSMLCNFRV